MATRPSFPYRDWVTIALVSAAVLCFEIAITRVLSVVVWYHFAFLAVSLAMLGLSVPGVWFALHRPPRAARGWLLVASGIAAPLSVSVIVHSGALLPRTGFESARSTPAHLAVVVVCVLVPLLCMGAVICLLLLEAGGRRIAAMYGFDLLGATCGALLVVPLMSVVATPTLVAATGLLPLAAALTERRRVRWVASTVLAGSVALMVWQTPFELGYSKSYVETEVDRLVEEWTPTARLTVFRDVFWRPDPEAGFVWGMGSRYRPRPVEQLWMEQDGSAGTPITRFEGNLAEVSHLDYDVTSVAYQFRPPARACIIGAGGGRDILTALRSNASHVDAVELNPRIIDIVDDRFGEYSGGVYGLPGVRAHASEGRSFLTRADARYDLIQIALTDSWAATSAGAYALSENYLYTVEAVRLYWNRLSPTGVLSISRWLVGDRQLESARLALLAVEALGREGVESPREHMAVMQAGWVGTTLVSKTPFGRRDVARLDAIADERGFRRHWPPAPRTPESIVARVLTEGSGRLEALGIDLSPPTDDRPFFFQTVDFFTPIDAGLLEILSLNDRSVVTLRFLLVLLSAIALVLFVLPFPLARVVSLRGSPAFRSPSLWRGSAYFASIGAAFMLVEVPWIQQHILYLGHPSYATTVVLSTLLLGAGVGSIAAGRSSPARVGAMRWLLPASVAAFAALAPVVHEATLGRAFEVRVVLGVFLVGPPGFFMGFAFPIGMMRFGDAGKAWFWAMNGAFGVLASVASLALAMAFGLTAVIWIGVGAYVAACLLLGGRGPG